MIGALATAPTLRLAQVRSATTVGRSLGHLAMAPETALRRRAAVARELRHHPPRSAAALRWAGRWKKAATVQEDCVLAHMLAESGIAAAMKLQAEESITCTKLMAEATALDAFRSQGHPENGEDENIGIDFIRIRNVFKLNELRKRVLAAVNAPGAGASPVEVMDAPAARVVPAEAAQL